jgi:nickel-dependent lactate racemase
MTRRIGGPDEVLHPAAIDRFVDACFADLDLDGRSLCLVIPDATRNCPVAVLLAAIESAVRERVRSCTSVIALGTHAPMSSAAIATMVGPVGFPVQNHEWRDPSAFVSLGTLSAATVSTLSGGLLDEPVGVRINRLVTESDVTVIVGPVLPHEVVGFSGGNKYLFPGLSGQELIDVTHWLGALLTSAAIIGTPGVTPVRALIDAAAARVPGERHALCVVVDHATGGLHAASFGSPSDAWADAAAVAAVSHITYLDAPMERVLSLVSPRYQDLWTGAKGFYKVEPIVAEGGDVVLYAPHITEIAAMHPGQAGIGYHCRDYFLAHWEEYEDHPRGELAHSTHLYGAGTWDPTRGERQRVRVTLATGIPEAVVRRANLGYLDPRSVDVEHWRADPGALVVPDAGEVLYRLRG